MGASASIQQRDSKPSSSSVVFEEDGLNKEYSRLRREGNVETDIYKSLRETYGSLRKEKFIVLNVTVKNMALQQLSKSLHENRTKFLELDNQKEVAEEKSPKYRKGRKPELKVFVDEEDSSYPSPFGESNSNTPAKELQMFSNGTLQVGNLTIGPKGMTMNGDHAHDFLLSGRSDFVEIRVLGNGANGRVIEALHIPTLTLVALKMLPVNSAEDMHSICNEIEVLYQNLAELQLVDDFLHQTDSHELTWGTIQSNTQKRSTSAHEHAARTIQDIVNGSFVRHGTTAVSPDEEFPDATCVRSSCPQVLGMYEGMTMLSTIEIRL
jgi:hypothetical protein